MRNSTLMLLIFEQPDHPIVMWSKPIVLSSNYCKNKRGIVGELGISYYGVIYFDEFSCIFSIG